MQQATQATAAKPRIWPAHAAVPNRSATMPAAASGARTSNGVPRWSTVMAKAKN